MSRAAAESYVSSFETGLNLFAFAAGNAFADARDASARLAAEVARSDAAAHAAAGAVYQGSAATLREKLADAESELDFMRDERRDLLAELAAAKRRIAELSAARV
jgi:demethoxyubiquinone hydroxylase (CLK1/Coq7/Cat5 family)